MWNAMSTTKLEMNQECLNERNSENVDSNKAVIKRGIRNKIHDIPENPKQEYEGSLQKKHRPFWFKESNRAESTIKEQVYSPSDWPQSSKENIPQNQIKRSNSQQRKQPIPATEDAVSIFISDIIDFNTLKKSTHPSKLANLLDDIDAE